MDTRDIMRKEVSEVSRITGEKKERNLNSIKDCREAIKKMYEKHFDKKFVRDKEELFDKISSLEKEISSLKTDNISLKTKLEKEKNKNLEHEKNHSIDLTSKRNLENELKISNKKLIELQDKIISIHERILELQEINKNLEKQNLNSKLDIENLEDIIKKLEKDKIELWDNLENYKHFYYEIVDKKGFLERIKTFFIREKGEKCQK